MIAKPEIVPKTALFGKVVAYECCACGKSFPVPCWKAPFLQTFPYRSLFMPRFSLMSAKAQAQQARSEK
jgi:hypothetical protein